MINDKWLNQKKLQDFAAFLVYKVQSFNPSIPQSFN